MPFLLFYSFSSYYLLVYLHGGSLVHVFAEGNLALVYSCSVYTCSCLSGSMGVFSFYSLLTCLNLRLWLLALLCLPQLKDNVCGGQLTCTLIVLR